MCWWICDLWPGTWIRNGTNTTLLCSKANVCRKCKRFVKNKLNGKKNVILDQKSSNSSSTIGLCRVYRISLCLAFLSQGHNNCKQKGTSLILFIELTYHKFGWASSIYDKTPIQQKCKHFRRLSSTVDCLPHEESLAVVSTQVLTGQ